MRYRLVRIDAVRGGDTERWVIQPPVIIGRNPELEVSIDDESVSRAHCQLFLGSDEALNVRDMNSKNGTYVNDTRITHTTLAPGDILQLGSVILRVEFASDTNPGKPQVRPQSKSMSTTVTQPVLILKKEPPPQKSSTEKPWWKFW